MDYFVGIAGKQEGPWSEGELRRRIADGTLGGDSLCWTAGWPEWRKLRDALPDAFTVSSPPPPPVPTPVAERPMVAREPLTRWSTPPTDANPTPTSFAQEKTSEKAIWSLALGIIGCFLGLPSIVLGHLARTEIRESRGRVGGGGLALAGLILGYLWVVAGAITFVLLAMSEPSSDVEEETLRDFRATPDVESTALYDESQGKLRQIALASLRHAYRHGGRLPDSMEPLREIFGGQFAALMDLPFTDDVEDDGYAIVPGVTTSLPLTTVIAYELRARADGRRAVAYLNGTVALVDEDEVP